MSNGAVIGHGEATPTYPIGKGDRYLGHYELVHMYWTPLNGATSANTNLPRFRFMYDNVAEVLFYPNKHGQVVACPFIRKNDRNNFFIACDSDEADVLVKSRGMTKNETYISHLVDLYAVDMANFTPDSGNFEKLARLVAIDRELASNLVA